MKQKFLILLITFLVGCATNKAGLPSFEGKPRVKINQRVPAPAPVNDDSQRE